eukprot:2289570-Prymnesium_polylepis.1
MLRSWRGLEQGDVKRAFTDPAISTVTRRWSRKSCRVRAAAIGGGDVTAMAAMASGRATEERRCVLVSLMASDAKSLAIYL